MEGKFQTWVPLANAAFTAWDSCPSQAPCGVSSCPGVRTAHALRGSAPRPGPGTACRWRRNSRSFCNNFWNWPAFLNFYPHLPRRRLWKGLWIRWPGKGWGSLASVFCAWPGLVVLCWLSASTGLLTRIGLLHTQIYSVTCCWNLNQRLFTVIFRTWKDSFKANRVQILATIIVFLLYIYF